VLGCLPDPVPLILFFCIIGVYSINSNIYEVLIMGSSVSQATSCGNSNTKQPLFSCRSCWGLHGDQFPQSALYSEGDPTIFFKRPISAHCSGVALILLFLASAETKKEGLGGEGTANKWETKNIRLMKNVKWGDG